jgi:hypothetical protein
MFTQYFNFRHICTLLAIVFFGIVFSLLFTAKTFAATGINRQINFQGRLVNNTTGLNVSNGSYSVVFTLYNNGTAGQGTALWTETQNVTATDGIFRVALGSVTPIPANFNFNWDGLYLGIKVGTDAEMTPRIQMAAVPFAFNAAQVAGLTIQDSATGTAGSTSATLRIGTSAVSPITVDLGTNNLTFSTSGTTTLTLPTSGTLVTTTLGSDITGNSKNITTLAGLTVNGGGAINSAAAGTLGIGTATTTGLTFGNNSVTNMMLNFGTSGSLVLTKGATALSCAGNANGGKLTTDASGNVSCQDDTSGSGGGTNYFGQTAGLTYIGNTTTDFAIGGNSTASADFVFGSVNSPGNGGIAIATFSGELMMAAQANSSSYDQTNWQQVSGTAGTLGGGTANVASVSAMAVFNGSLYAGTYNAAAAGAAEVYRYNSGTSWTLVSQSGGTGQIRSGGTTGIASVSAMTVFNGNLYVGTSKMGAAEVYRYDGGTNWTLISSTTPGTIGTVTGINGVSAMGVYLGQLYIGTRATTSGVGAARLMRWEGGNTWTSLNGTAGTFVTTNTVGVQAVTSIAAINGALYFGIYSPQGDADVLKWTGAATFLALNLASATGSYSINGSAVTGFTQSIVTVLNGNLIVGLTKPAGGDVVSSNQDIGETGINTFTRLNNIAGQMTNGGTSSIDSVSAMTVYNGMLYVATAKAKGQAEVYRYTGADQKFFKVSQSTLGQISSGGTTGIDAITMFAPMNGDLYAGTQKLLGGTGNAAEVYKLPNVNISKSYSLVFQATSPMGGGAQNNNINTASIFYLASASANLGNSSANSGAFIFDHAIQTRNGSYDVAEDYPTRDDTLSSGDLVSIDPSETGFVKKTTEAYDYAIIGVYSTNPALRLSQQDSAIDGGNVIPVALAGRVPVKVSTESGEIKPGDYLTSSSTPGVAMKATKSGGVVGQAMEGYNGDGVGQVLMYVKSMTYDGSIADSFVNLDTNSPSFEANVLSSLGTQKTTGSSSIVTDRLVAGLEIITPSITTTNLTADTITAKLIKADQIEGLQIYTNQLGSLTDVVASLQSLTGSKSAVLGVATSAAALIQSAELALPSDLTLSSLSVGGLATVSGDLNVQNNSLIQGALTVLNNITTQNLLVSQFAYFIQDVVFKGNVRFDSTPTFNNDTAGFAVVKQGSDNVKVTFTQEYVNPPVVTASIALDQLGDDVAQKQLEDQIFNNNLSYIVTQNTTKGFVIKLNKAVPEDIKFSWIALSVKDVKLAGGGLVITPSPEATGSAAFQSIINQLNNSPSPAPPQ